MGFCKEESRGGLSRTTARRRPWRARSTQTRGSAGAVTVPATVPPDAHRPPIGGWAATACYPYEAGHRPRLPLPLEHRLVLAAKHDSSQRAVLVDAFAPLIASVARIYRGSDAVDRGELMQEGAVGLLRALERYDSSLDTPFWAYASWWVRQAMQQLVSELTRPVVLSDRAVRQLARIKDAQREFMQAHGKEPTAGELATETGVARDQIERLIAAERKPRALEEPINGDEGVVGSFGDLLADPRAEDAYDGVPWRLEIDELPGMLGVLSEREQLVLRGRYGLGGREERTLRELASTLGVSAERVRQIEQAALDKLRAEAEDGHFRRPRHRRLCAPPQPA
ncbi:MAG: polymerase primary sigma factor [Solirubrobacteraceae bacterium]|nr:polymerase primary sigma factor [Solirubrobacteraceae bacterium]